MYSEYVSEFRTCVWIDEHPWHLSWRRGLQGRAQTRPIHHSAQWRRKWSKIITCDFSVFQISSVLTILLQWSSGLTPIKVKCDTFDPVSVHLIHLIHLIQYQCIGPGRCMCEDVASSTWGSSKRLALAPIKISPGILYPLNLDIFTQNILFFHTTQLNQWKYISVNIWPW